MCLSSNNHFNLDWVGERRLKNGVMVLEYVPPSSPTPLPPGPPSTPSRASASTRRSRCSRCDHAASLGVSCAGPPCGEHEDDASLLDRLLASVADSRRGRGARADDECGVPSSTARDGRRAPWRFGPSPYCSRSRGKRLPEPSTALREPCTSPREPSSAIELDYMHRPGRSVASTHAPGPALIPGSDVALALRCIPARDAVFDCTAPSDGVPAADGAPLLPLRRFGDALRPGSSMCS